ncbi:MAG: diacylglycerol kinase family lipid kinase [Hornefia sp.]|nr:diacylglycerol kinase family lipid kinase [Hornefia sp.]
MKRVLIILNPRAGTRQANRKFAEIVDIFCREGYKVSVATTGKSGDGRVFAKDRAKDHDLIVCIGGDGTFNEVASGLLESGCDIPIGYIPAGSTNDFASSLGLSKGIIHGAKDIATGIPITLDMGSFNDRFFSYVASFGAFTQTSYSVPQDMKNLLGHTAYILEGIKDIPSIKPLKLRITNEQGVYGGEYIFGAICNSTSMGGIITLDKNHVDMNDGLFEVILIKSPKNIIELTQITWALTKNTYRECPYITFFSSSNLEIEADENMPWTLDGEYQKGFNNITVKNLKSAIRIVVSKYHVALDEYK